LKNEEHGYGLSRREIMKGTLKAGVYAAPVILSSGRVAAATSLPSGTPVPTATSLPSGTPVPTATSLPTSTSTPTPILFPVTLTFGQDALLTDAGPRASFDVYYTLSNQPPGTLTFLGTITTDNFGFGGGVFPLTVDARVVTFVTLTYFLSGNPPTSPPVTTFMSTLVSALNPVNGMRQPVTFGRLVVQEPTAAACQTAPTAPTQFTEYVDAAILNAMPGITYTIFVQSNRHTTPVMVTTATTNVDGNVTVFAGALTPLVGATPTSVVVTAVPTNGGPTLTLTASGASLVTIPCSAFTVATTAIRAIGITRS